MEDALISPEGIAILTGAGLIAATDENPVYVHTTEEILIDKDDIVSVEAGKVKIENLTLSQEPATASGFGVYVMLKDKDGYIISEPFSNLTVAGGAGKLEVAAKKVTSAESTAIPGIDTEVTSLVGYSLFVDYYVEKKAGSGAVMVDITPDKFAGSYYIEASTLFRDQATGRDDAAEFIIPNGKIQSNFTFTMAGSGDPSTFSFVVDALKGRIKGTNHDTLAAIQIIPSTGDGKEPDRDATDSAEDASKN